MKLSVVLASLFFSFNASAASVNSWSFNSVTKSFELNVTYGGGCKEHKFSLEFGACQMTSPIKCPNVQLVDAETQDFCRAIVTKDVVIPAAETAFDAESNKGAVISICGDNQKCFTNAIPY